MFQKNLIVWKLFISGPTISPVQFVSEELNSVETSFLTSYILETSIVSEELNSVETCWYRMVFKPFVRFQKNLIVWKLICTSSIVSEFGMFQKNLIVWKHIVHSPVAYSSEGFRRT